MKVAVVIPSWIGHVEKLPRMLASISAQTRMPTLVVLRISSLPTDFELCLPDTPFPLQVIRCEEHQSAAQNRNAACAVLPDDIDIVSFFDSDDWMHPRRLEYIERAFQESPSVDVVLHGYISELENNFPGWSFSEYLFHQKGFTIHPKLNKVVFPNDSHASGHVSVRKSVWEECPFPANPSTVGIEDTVFLLNLFQSGYSFGFLPSKLSFYIQCSVEERFEKDGLFRQQLKC